MKFWAALISYMITFTLPFPVFAGNRDQKKTGRSERQCDNLLRFSLNEKKPSFGTHETRIFGGDQTTYSFEMAIATNRSIIYRHTEKTDRAISTIELAPVAYPVSSQSLPLDSESYSRIELTQQNGKDILVLEEKWGLFEGALGDGTRDRLNTHSFWLGGVRLVLIVPIEFTVGSRSDYFAGKPVTFQTTSEGADMAAKQFFESVFTTDPRHFWSSLSKDRAIEALMEESNAYAGIVAEFGTNNREPREKLVAQAKKLASRISRIHEPISIPKSLPLIFKGTRSSLIATYPNPLTFEYLILMP